ncbi:MAG: LeuA family protein [Betaproteobacteria bacterium]
MSETPWKSDKWFVSPWNFEPEVRQGMEFKRQIQFHDVSLRDGEQQAGITFSKDDKVRIAEKLAEAGIHRIEAGMPAVSKQDEEAIKEIARRKLGPKIFAFARCMVDDVKRARDCGVDGVVVEIPSSTHIIQYAYKWPLQKAIDLSVEATRYAREQGLYTVFFPIDGTRAEFSWFLNLIETVARDGHMDALGIVDTFGGISPHAVGYLVKRVKERVKKPLEVHFHDDFGLGAANTIIALAAGADVAHTTVTAIGERAGNTPYEDVALGLKVLYGVDTGIKTEKMYELSKLVRKLAGIEVRPNRPIVGDMIFKIESGIISSWFKNCGLENAVELMPFRWDVVGQEPVEVVLGKNSGADSIRMWLDRIGVDATDEQVNTILWQVKDFAYEHKRLMTQAEFEALVAKVVK